jgi:hypothetical protein
MRSRQQLANALARAALRVGLAGILLLISRPIMAKECLLTAPLVVKDLQSGFVGQTGTVWTVGADCTYTVARQIGLNVFEPHRRGRLNAEQQQRLAALIARADLADPPKQLGGSPQPNMRQVTISYGKTSSALNLPSSGAEAWAVGDNPSVTGILELTRAIDEIIGE